MGKKNNNNDTSQVRKTCYSNFYKTRTVFVTVLTHDVHNNFSFHEIYIIYKYVSQLFQEKDVMIF